MRSDGHQPLLPGRAEAERYAVHYSPSLSELPMLIRSTQGPHRGRSHSCCSPIQRHRFTVVHLERGQQAIRSDGRNLYARHRCNICDIGGKHIAWDTAWSPNFRPASLHFGGERRTSYALSAQCSSPYTRSSCLSASVRRLDLARNDAFGHGTELERKRRSGFMLDTARNFYPVPALYKMLDTMSSVKMNVFHWHVVDAQSWPLVSSTFPDLARYGAYSDAETYSIHDVGQVVKYAGARGISVMLEVSLRRDALSMRPETLNTDTSVSSTCPDTRRPSRTPTRSTLLATTLGLGPHTPLNLQPVKSHSVITTHCSSPSVSCTRPRCSLLLHS